MRGASRAARLLAGLLAALAVVATALAPGAPAAASDGDLDPSFGGDGTVTLDTGSIFPGFDDSARAVAIQPDGKIVVAGEWQGPGSETFALARLNPDGTLDTSFGAGGLVLTAFPNGPAAANAVAIQPDGRIVAAGWWDDDDGVADADFALTRYHSDGSLDTSFFGDGKLTSDAGGDDVANALAVAPSGTIVAAGSTDAGGRQKFEISRIDADPGAPGGGAVFGTSVDFGADAGASALTIQPDGKIVAAGFVIVNSGSGDVDFALARVGTGGGIDSTFSADGGASTSITLGNDRANALAIQDDGKIVAAGFANGDFGLARYNPDGSLDPSFSGDGKVTTDLAPTRFGDISDAFGLAIQPDGKIVAAGEERVAVGDFDFALARYTPDGSLDPSFSADGLLTTSFGGSDSARAVVLQPDTRIVAAGFTNAGAGSDYDFALARYLGDTIPPETIIDAGPAGATGDPTPSFAFHSTAAGSAFACSLDGGAFAPCASPHTTPLLADGAHTFRVRATDAAGNTDPTPALRTFTVDTTPPTAAPQPPTTTPPTGTPPRADRTPPVISRASLSHRRFRVGRRPTATAAAKRHRAPVGTRIRFTLSEPATVRIEVQRRLAGLRVRRNHKTRCVKPTRRLRHHRRCVRWRRAGTLVRALAAGSARVAFSGRTGRRKLHPGRYRLRITAADRAGNRSKPTTLRFTILRPRRTAQARQSAHALRRPSDEYTAGGWRRGSWPPSGRRRRGRLR